MKSLNFGADFSSKTTLGPVASLVLAMLSEGPLTLEEINERRANSRSAVASLVARGLVEERERGGVVRFALSTKSARQLGHNIRDTQLGRRFGIVVTGVSELSNKLLNKTSTFRRNRR